MRLLTAAALFACGHVFAASIEVGAYKPPTRVEEVRAMLDYAIWNPRISSVYDLGEMGSEALPLLVYASDDADWQVRLTAAHFLGKAGPDAAGPLYEIAKREPCPRVRLLALRGLSKLGREGSALYREVLTPEDEAELARMPPESRLGRSVVIDTPQGDMTKEFFDGDYIDHRVCASSERAGRLRRHLKWPRGKKRENWSNEVVITPEVTAGRDLKREAFEREEREYLERERLLSASEKKTKRELDELFSERREPETMPKAGAGATERAVAKGSATFAAVDARRMKPALIEEPARPNTATAEVMPAAPAGIFREGPRAGKAEIAADKGTGKAEYDPLPDLLRQLRAVEPRKRARAADELGKRGTAAARAVPLLRKALKDRDRRVRASAALALGSVAPGDKAVAAELKRSLRDKDEDVRFSAMLALRRSVAPR